MTSTPLPRGAAPTLSLSPLSPVATAAVFCRLGGALWATVVVKATFQLVHGEAARLIQPLDLITADQANANNGSLERARETAPHMPNAGVLLTGHAHAPAGRAVPSMSVRLGISREKPVIDKTLHVFGARAAANAGAITPFQKMPLVYERAFGGAGVWENPVGVGGPGSVSLPNVVDPRDPRRVAGFGPIAPQWAPRRALLGGVAQNVFGSPAWEVPAGFDWRFFQAAPADQQLERLHGDEWIVLDGMHPTLARVQSRLPGVTAAARRDTTSAPGGATQPVDLRADMLVIDADDLRASLVWRGRFAVPSMEVLAATRLLVGTDLPGKPVEWPASPAAKAQAYSTETRDVDVRAILGGAVPFAPDRPSALPLPAAEPKPEPMSTGTGLVDVRALLKGPVPFAAAAATAGLKVPGGPVKTAGDLPATAPELPVAEAPALPFSAADASRPPAASMPTPAAHKPSPMSTGTTDINLAEVMKGALRHRGTSAPNPPAAPAPAVAEPAAPPPDLVEPPAAPAPLPAPLPAPSPLAAAPPAAPPPPAALLSRPSPAIPEAAPPETRPLPASAPPAPGPPAAARHRAAVSLGENLDGQDLSGADLSGLDLSGRSLQRCILRGARLRGANLSGANLTGAVLDEADLRGANLSGADLQEASLVRADLERASLSRCRAAGANLTDANLRAADLRAASLPGARLNSAVLREAEAAGADFGEARLDRADLSEATFRRANLKKANLAGANLDRADLRQATLEGADLRGSSRRLTKLAGAHMAGAQEGADLPSPG